MPPAPPPLRGRKCHTAWRIALPAVVVLCALVGWFHPFVLSHVARRLIVEQTPFPVDRIVINSGEGRFEEAAAGFLSGGVEGIVLLEEEPNRPVRLGILPSSIAAARQSLLGRGVPDAAITDVHGNQRCEREAARQLGSWLKEHPELRVQFLCRRLESAAWRATFDAELETSAATRILVRGLPDRSYDEARWWRSRSGIRAVCLAYVGRLYDRLGDGERVPRKSWDPDAFEQELRRGSN